MTKKIMIENGGGAAWRARYIYLGETLKSARLIAHIGIDPTASPGPQVFGSVAGKSFRVLVPTLRWKHRASPLRKHMYQIQQHLILGLDGRYGWGAKSAA